MIIVLCWLMVGPALKEWGNRGFSASAVDSGVHLELVPPASLVLQRAEPQTPQQTTSAFELADSLNMGQGILIEWKWSQSSDLVEQRIERRKEGSPSWTTLRSFDQDTIERYSEHDDLISLVGGMHIDTTAQMGLDYDYRVLAVDDAGNRSSSDIITATPFDNGLRGQISNLI